MCSCCMMCTLYVYVYIVSNWGMLVSLSCLCGEYVLCWFLVYMKSCFCLLYKIIACFSHIRIDPFYVPGGLYEDEDEEVSVTYYMTKQQNTESIQRVTSRPNELELRYCENLMTLPNSVNRYPININTFSSIYERMDPCLVGIYGIIVWTHTHISDNVCCPFIIIQTL